MGHKIATCCYCGTRAALKLDTVRHELACRGCGAPLHNLKQMPVEPKASRSQSDSLRNELSYTRKRKKKSKKKKAKLKDWDLFDDLFDIVEDIFD